VRRGCGTKPKRPQTMLRKRGWVRIDVRGATHQCINQIQIYENDNHHGEFRGGIWPAPTGLALQVESQLPPEEQILSDHRSAERNSTSIKSQTMANVTVGGNHSAFLPRRRGSRSISNTIRRRPPSRASNFSRAQLFSLGTKV
jgi:hypothetical protein